MSEIIYKLFGDGKDLNSLQFTDRAIVIFIIAIALVRISGRRSFGVKTPFDTTIAILLGSILGRAVAGVSPFVPTVAGCLALVVLHRILAWAVLHYPSLARLVRGKPIPLYKDGKFIDENMKRGLVTKEDILEHVRLKALMPDFEKVESAWLETTGEIAIVKKKDA